MFEPTVISLGEVQSTAKSMMDDGWRLITMTVTDLGDAGYDHLYHFDKNLEQKDFRVTITKGAKVPSISGIYFAAMLIENENRDLFGLEYEGLVLDFNRTLYLEECGEPLTAPFCKISTFTKPMCEV
ncbi:NADH-quinone oxidoreductase subunit C [Desulfovibrio sp. OttesenSCG-928-G15]|nr:NADH-quinone oxidoreductase subunit C [Desulfovibrio sp. OttesenSCG-928-G15]